MTAKTEDVFQARGPIRLAETEGCTIWQFRNKTGDGTMAAYEVFPGAMVSFNDFHMARYDSGYVADRELLAIDHCREGRMEYQAGENPPSLFKDQDSGASSLSGCGEHSGKRDGAALFLPDPGGKSQGGAAVPHGSYGGKFHPGGAFPAVRFSADADEKLFPLRTGKAEDEVLHGIDLKLSEGSFTALVGPSGGGKSTVAKLIARFWDVMEGSILEKCPLYKDMWQAHIGAKNWAVSAAEKEA